MTACAAQFRKVSMNSGAIDLMLFELTVFGMENAWFCRTVSSDPLLWL
jgi:hypothetical protein